MVGCYSLTGLQDDGIDLGLTLDGFVCDFRTMHEEEALGARAPLAAVALWPWSRMAPFPIVSPAFAMSRTVWGITGNVFDGRFAQRDAVR